MSTFLPMQLWWLDRHCRPNQEARKDYKSRKAQTELDNTVTDQDVTEQEISFNDWDEWFASVKYKLNHVVFVYVCVICVKHHCVCVMYMYCFDDIILLVDHIQSNFHLA